MLLNVLNDYGLEQMVKIPTRVAENVSNILDLFVTNVPQLVGRITNCEGSSDHLAVIVDLEGNMHRAKVKKSIKLFSRADFEFINHRLYQYYLEFREVATLRSVNENWVHFKQYLMEVEKLVPVCNVNVNGDPPWHNRELKRLDNKQRKLHQKAKQRKCDRIGTGKVQRISICCKTGL